MNTLTDSNPSAIQEMFGSIAKRYDITNTVLSCGIHHLWKNKTVNLIDPNSFVLDLCTGTGDLLAIMSKKQIRSVGADFCFPMLEVASKRQDIDKKNSLILADGTELPFADESFDTVTVAFGIRNIPQLDSGLHEIRRVLKKNGTLLILEFGQIENPFLRYFYGIYSKYFMPLIGKILTGNYNAYAYLPETASKFPCGKKFEAVLEKNFFSVKNIDTLSFGIGYIYHANRK